MKSMWVSFPWNTHEFQNTLTDSQSPLHAPFSLPSFHFCHFRRIFNEFTKFAEVTLKPNLFCITREMLFFVNFMFLPFLLMLILSLRTFTWEMNLKCQTSCGVILQFYSLVITVTKHHWTGATKYHTISFSLQDPTSLYPLKDVNMSICHMFSVNYGIFCKIIHKKPDSCREIILKVWEWEQYWVGPGAVRLDNGVGMMHHKVFLPDFTRHTCTHHLLYTHRQGSDINVVNKQGCTQFAWNKSACESNCKNI